MRAKMCHEILTKVINIVWEKGQTHRLQINMTEYLPQHIFIMIVGLPGNSTIFPFSAGAGLGVAWGKCPTPHYIKIFHETICCNSLLV